ncbi:hypothetical protein ACQ4PT_064509 [Festuca glaucescens]
MKPENTLMEGMKRPGASSSTGSARSGRSARTRPDTFPATHLSLHVVQQSVLLGGADIFFSVEMEHNGIFCGIGEGLQYASPTVAYIDYCNKDTWSLLWIEDILKQLGHVIDDKLHVYWCLPGKTICEGLVLIKSDEDILEMIKAADTHKTLCLMVDHSDFLRNLRRDVIINRRQQVPPAVCPKKNITRDVVAAEGTSKSVEDDFDDFYKEYCQEEDSEDNDDSNFVDSDFEVEEGDDDLFRDNVDTEVNDNNEAVQVQDLEDDDALEDADLNLRKEQREKLKYKFGTFNPQVDMDNPVFKMGVNEGSERVCKEPEHAGAAIP